MNVVRKVKDRSPRWLRKSADRVTRGYGMVTSRSRGVPDYLIIGTKRGGTTSLFNYLIRHPGVIGMFPRSRDLKSTDYFFPQGHSAAWYRSHFPTERERQRRARALGYATVSGEASPYYCWDPRIAPSVQKVAPHVKAIFLVRDPVKRAWSHYQERVQNGVEPLSFLDALEAEDDRLEGERERMLSDPNYYSPAFDWYSYRSRGEYLPQIENWLGHFPREQLLVLRAEDLYSQTQETFDRVCEFLSLPAVSMPTRKPFNATWRTSDGVPERAGEFLARYYADHNTRLERFLGQPMHW